ncbi:UvrD-helicase domain-containing protein [Parasphingorhabdus halotolerans]|uniref:ATP-dependent helicase n=1 Tax=Parasphingorhabdus halotolerans TaxID=2725558 RepID=A0A6H2DPE4_9SPHN|nr:UvrD-helicase domain-containing protein [Parasphingorhabdus halotolerans]QJB69853.1 ATP-dependent helicase [Parasphingorhabdus halotolerans]
MSDRIQTAADEAVRECLATNRSFALIAGAGSGKTTSLVDALGEVRKTHGETLRQNGQRVACITFTKRAVAVIGERLGFDDLYKVSTLHSFLWGEIGRFGDDIRDALINHRLPALIAKAAEQDTGKETKTARKAREKVARLENELAGLPEVVSFSYDDAVFSDYLNGKMSHDDVIEIAGYLFRERATFRRLIGARYPFIFVDEAQDTFVPIVEGINQTCAQPGLPIVGYFGDPWQQIYDGRAGDFAPPEDGLSITKVENFRCSPQVIEFLNAFRADVQQVAAGPNADVEGSVEIKLVRAEAPEGERKRYSDAQLDRALAAMDQAIEGWGWTDQPDIIRLFLVRQMIARRLKFSGLQQLFTGQFASMRAQDDYESGDHHLLKPFLTVICPLIEAFQNNESRKIIDILRTSSPAYDPHGSNADRKLKDMIDQSQAQLKELVEHWEASSIKDVLTYCRDRELIPVSDRLAEQLDRAPRTEEFDEELHNEEKGDWLADGLFAMPTTELFAYRDFISENTPYSTQHGVKGEEYPNVLVVFDDIEASWNQYSFSKLLTPGTAGEPTEGQQERGRKLAYVCFSRAERNLKILFFTPEPEKTKAELIERKLIQQEQISIA